MSVLITSKGLFRGSPSKKRSCCIHESVDVLTTQPESINLGKRKIKDSLKRLFLFIYKLGTRFGIHIIPVHYYSPVPNILELEKTKDEWAKKSKLPGISINLDDQINNLRNICLPYQNEFVGNKFYNEGVLGHFGPGYGYIEAQALHCIIRHYNPRRIIEIGSGVSTYCIAEALKINRSGGLGESSLTCIDLHPSEQLRNFKDINLLQEKVQNIPYDFMMELESRDLLFVDSSHTIKPGSDVNYILLEVLPRLKNGVIVHFHDIFFPYDYQRDVLQTYLHWMETSLLRAFLIFNNKARIIFSLSHLHYDCKYVLKEVFPEYEPQKDIDGLVDKFYKPFEQCKEHFPSSIYICIQEG